MSVSEWYIVSGDEEPAVRIRVSDIRSFAVDLADVTSTWLEVSSDGGQTWSTITGGGSVEQGDVDDTDAAARLAAGNSDTPVRYWYAVYAWSAGQTDALNGDYLARVGMERSGGNSLHSPSGAPWLILHISP